MFSSLETRALLEFQSKEALSKKKLKRDYLYSFIDPINCAAEEGCVSEEHEDDLGGSGSLPYTAAMNLNFWNQKFF